MSTQDTTDSGYMATTENTNTERDYPPLPEPDLGMPWRVNAKSDGAAHSCGFTHSQMRAYVDADRKARASLSPPAALPEGISRDETVYGETYFTAADMATAAAQGFRDGVAMSLPAACGNTPYDEGPFTLAESLPAAGQEPVAWQGAHDPTDLYYRKPPQADVHPLYRVAPQPAVAAGWVEGIEAAAKLLEKKADDFAQQHGYDDMGSLSFGRSAHADAKLDYHSGLLELAEEVRAMNEHAVHPANDGTHVLMEHSGCGRGTQVDTLMVRLNPGDKVIFHQGPITRAMLKAAPLPPAPSTEGESNV